MFIHNCTFYHLEGETWKRHPVEGVLWQNVQGENVVKSGINDANTLELYIPFFAEYTPHRGDLVVKGIIDYEIKKKPSELMEAFDVRIVRTVDTCDFGSLKHYEVGGK